jgi:hypothetical protein
MSRSFYIGNYDELYTGSNNFLQLISDSPEVYGLDSARVASYAALNAAYAEKYLMTLAPATRTRSALADRNQTAVPLRKMASNLTKTINGTRTVTDGQKTALGIAVRGARSPMPPPGLCSDFKTRLLADGSIELRWRANNPKGMSGVTYQVWRCLGDVGEFAFVGACGVKKFVDSTIPAGTAQAQYQIRGIRPTAAGPWAQFNVNFGHVMVAATSAGMQAEMRKQAA